MLHGIGVECKKVSDWLISLYVSLQDILPRGERPHLLQLIQSGLTTVQQTDRGAPRGEAVQWAAEEVFVKSVNNTASRKVGTDWIMDFFIFKWFYEDKMNLSLDFQAKYFKFNVEFIFCCIICQGK